ncbi:YjgP/YjgQ family permease [Bizionia argentinensis JUB59]|uniref:YjgP/YjgQ family permease n=1 Tax=Bizionia argentinensis JUB59 TaxID=1046627 RepID=G2E902_9FLAO|nr:LptF/LptG family permease [Bizionia argentinensis]EGV45065.2 YjgP/YjgQ family permease [Bizionia argentinensis JUB59]
MKILDRYILTTYLKTFFSVFIILMLIFVLQTVWLYIKELAGKDLDMIVVFKFLFYFMPKLIPLVLPLTILLSSIMVFGSFSENYEFAAMKSTGTSLQRAMAGLSIFIVGLAVITFFFANNVIPAAEYESHNLRKNIATLKPAMVIAEGQFNDVMVYNIKVAKKSGKNGRYLTDVIMHKKNTSNNANNITIIAKEGELIGEEDSDVLQFILYDGYFYDDTSDRKNIDRHPMVKTYFEKYTINLDLSQLNNNDLDEKNVTDKYNMLNISDLNYTIDSLGTALTKDREDFAISLYNRSNLPVLNSGITVKKDIDSTYSGNILDLFTDKKKVQMLDQSLNSLRSTKQILNVKSKYFKERYVYLNKHIIALHEKLALGFACIILFFVGAPLGALIRKGGLGLPMVIAIFLFLTYHFIGIFAKNSAKDGSLNPILAAWFSTLIMLPLGYYLTKRATADRGLFEFDHIIEPIKKLLKIGGNSEDKKDEESTSVKLVPEQELEVKTLLIDYKMHAKFSFIFYWISIVLFILYFIFRNNKLEQLANILIQVSAISAAIYVLYFILALINSFKLSETSNKLQVYKNPIIIIFGFILYPVWHFLLKVKINKVFSLNTK